MNDEKEQGNTIQTAGGKKEVRCETGYNLQWERDGRTLNVDTYRRCLPPRPTAETYHARCIPFAVNVEGFPSYLVEQVRENSPTSFLPFFTCQSLMAPSIHVHVSGSLHRDCPFLRQSNEAGPTTASSMQRERPDTSSTI